MFKNWSGKKDYFKFKELKPYSSLESLYQGSRKYRRVFDESECNYVNVELSFYNILFHEEDWDTEIVLKALDHKSNEEICNIKKNITVTKDLNIVHVREGWGTPDPGFWKKGTYKWQAFINGNLVGEVLFYIMQTGQVAPGYNPYFNIVSIKLFESPFEGVPYGNRTYMQAFNHAETHYINVEVVLENLITDESHFPLELQFNVYNDTRHLKAYMTYFKHITDRRSEIVLDAGYGTRKTGFWYKDSYSLEIIFMDQLIAVVPFEVGDENILFSGKYNYDVTSGHGTPIVKKTIDKEVSFDEAKEHLDGLIGMKQVKKQINELATYLRFKQLRVKKGLAEPEEFNLHSIFMGNPGTGKTTVALQLGKIYKSLGLLSNGKVHEVGRADLVGEFIGQTAPKVKKIIDKARGGVLFIDEAYALTSRGNDDKDYGREVMEVLLKEMSDGEGDIAIVAAGYPKEMERFLASNPGIRSRFTNIILFPDYTPNELMAIGMSAAKKWDVSIEPTAVELINKHIVEAYRNRSRMFGNARYMNGIIEQAKRNMGLRLMGSEDPESLSREQLSTINLGDIKKVFAKNDGHAVQMPVDQDLLQEALDELNELIGMSRIKNEVNEIVKLVRYYREVGRNLKDAFSLHTVFTGNPGTGKTSVARILVKIYKALGILERGQLVECDRKSLIAGFVGQTAIKTTAVIDEAIGGGLFIDEAYSLTAQSGFDFGRESVETILKRMEDQRGEFMVIVAGYPAEMKKFLESNPGLKSRFDKHFEFEDYKGEELLDIADYMFRQENLEMDTAAKAYLLNHFNLLLSKKNKYFGNARAVRKIVAESTRRHHLRLAELSQEERTPSVLNVILTEDLKHVKDKSDVGGAKMGFQINGE